MRVSMVLVCLLSLAFTNLVRSSESTAHATASDGAAAFEKLKSLTGEWDAPLKDGVMTDVFRPMAFGTAILHEEWKNGQQLTATVFYLVGSELRADHFCDLGNQLHYIAAEPDGSNVLKLKLRDATNLDRHPQHYHSITWHFIDANHHDQDWELVTPGKEVKTHHLVFTRRK